MVKRSDKVIAKITRMQCFGPQCTIHYARLLYFKK